MKIIINNSLMIPIYEQIGGPDQDPYPERGVKGE